MATKRLKRPRDPIQLGKLIVDIATGEVEDRRDDGKSEAAAEPGTKGGKASEKTHHSRAQGDSKTSRHRPLEEKPLGCLFADSFCYHHLLNVLREVEK